MSETIADMVQTSREAMVRRWLLEPTINPPPNDLTFREIRRALDQIEERVEQCRQLYPWSPPQNDHEAIIRSMPPHLRSGSKQDTAPVIMPASAAAKYREVEEGEPRRHVDISA